MEPDDFIKVYKTGFRYVWTCLRRMGIAERDIEDKVHDVFLVVHRRLDDFDTSRSLFPWLSGIAFRVAADYHRNAHQRREVTVEDVSDSVDDSANPEDDMSRLESRDLVLAALGRLNMDRRMVFVLYEIQGHTMKEVAEILELPVNTLYSRLRLAREQFTAAIRRLKPKVQVAP